MNFKIFIFVFLLLGIVSCNSHKNIVYLQNTSSKEELIVRNPEPLRLNVGDQLCIRVHSHDKDLAEIFNLERSDNRQMAKYTVNGNGQIDFPTLGLLQVEGMSKEEVSNMIKYRLLTSKMLSDPVVNVEFHNMGISILGEVNHPGWKEVDKDYITVLEAIALGGDLTINGRRDKVKVMRKEDDNENAYIIDLTDAQSLYKSEVYYLQSGDVVYIEPNMTRANQSTPNGNAFLTPTLWISIGSFALTLALLLLK